MTKKKPHGHNIGGSAKQKRRKENNEFERIRLLDKTSFPFNLEE